MEWLQPCLNWMEGEGLGHLSELCDGDEPFAPGGAPVSALSAAELLRCYTREILGISSARTKIPQVLPPEPGHAAAAPARK